MNAKEFYFHTISDLEQKAKSPERYDLLRSSGLMRQLLFDDNPLLHAANREFRLDFKFDILPWIEPSIIFPEAWMWQDIIPPPGSLLMTRRVTLDGFMSAICLRCGTARINIREVIKFCANVKGGIHWGKPLNKDSQRELDALDKVMRIGGLDASMNALPSIRKVLLAGIQPLTDAINREFSKT